MVNGVKDSQVLLVLIGGLGTGQTMILSYFFGSSQGSKNSADRFAALAQQIVEKPNPSPAVVDAIKTVAKKK
jgi:predicted ATPase